MSERAGGSSRRELLQSAGVALGLAGRAASGAQSGAVKEETMEICFKPATELAGLLRRKELSAREVLAAFLRQIERVNPKVNAICTLVPEMAEAQARRLDEALARGAKPGPLHGLPIAIKDLVDTKGIRTTSGSPIYKDNIPEVDALFVERLKASGAVVIGKTNVPEFGAGSHTYNPVFGVTRNPYDLGRSAGGSSGGGAAALASGMLPIADGSDLGGSVRNPPNFNNVVGIRPSPGRIPRYPSSQPWNSLPVLGPMARSVEDAGLLLSVMAGPDGRDPIAIDEEAAQFRGSLEVDLKGKQIAWSRDLGQFPVQTEVVEVIEQALPRFEELGCVVEEAHPDFSGADEIFQVLRAQGFAFGRLDDYENHRGQLKDTVVWNTEEGLKLSGLDVSKAQAARAELFHRVRVFFETYDYLLLPVSQVVPFPVEVDWVREIEGVKMETYVDWMKSCSFITLTEHPAMSMPCGFTAGGLPVGVQMVGRFRREIEVMRLAYAFEQLTRAAERRPEVAV